MMAEIVMCPMFGEYISTKKFTNEDIYNQIYLLTNIFTNKSIFVACLTIGTDIFTTFISKVAKRFKA